MKFIREKWAFFYRKIKQSCSDYRVTIIAVEVFTLYVILGRVWDDLYIKYDSGVTDFLFNDWGLLAFFALFILAAMFVESLFPYEKKQRNIKIARILGFVIDAAAASALAWGIRLEASEQIFHLSGDIVAEWCERFVIGYVLLLMIAIVYVCHKKSSVGFIEYILNVLVNYAIVAVIYVVLLLGTNLIILIVNLLFISGYSPLSGYSVILVTGIYYAPACIMALNDLSNSKELNDRISIALIKYVFSIMTICALAIVYIYLLKILIMWEIPSNKIFGIVAGLFCLGMPIWIMDYFYRDDTKYMRFLQKLPYGLIPLIPVQTYAVCVRIYHNGMTPSRYMGVCMIIFEVIMLFVWYFWKEKLERVLLILGAGIIVAIFIPGLNMYSVSNRWQRVFLESYYNKVISQGELTQEEYERLEGAYKYLKWEPQMKELVEQFDIYDADFLGQIGTLGIEEENSKKYHSIHCCQMIGNLDINGYNGFDMLNQDEAYDDRGESRLSVDLSAFRFYKRGSGEQEIIVVDLSEFADRCIDYENEHPKAGKDEFSEAMKPYTEIVIDDDTVLYLNHFQISYNEGMENGQEFVEVTSVNISGMLLSR